MASAPAIGFEYRPSRLIRRLRWSVAGLAMVALLVSGIDPPVRVLLVFVFLFAAGLGLARWRRVPSPTAVGWHPKSGWTVRMADGRDATMTLCSFRVLAGCIVLNLAGEGMRHDLWLLPDNSDADTRRRLRMRLAATGGEAALLR
jgi:toxin CptA